MSQSVLHLNQKQTIPLNDIGIQECFSFLNKMSEKSTINIQVEGIIGAGKTRLLNIIENSSELNEVEIFLEPIEKWTNLNQRNLLQEFYANPSSAAALTLQTYVYNTIFENHLKKSSKKIKVMERSVFSAMIFTQLQTESGNISKVDYDVLNHHHKLVVNNFGAFVKPDLIVYLDVDVPQCMKNISARSRTEEEGIPIDYMMKLDALHRKWIEGEIASGQNVSYRQLYHL